jgi:endonuclease/exonuclease/phosphatase family metal-dependent hydrolase
MLKLQSIKTQGFARFASTHLAVNIPNEEAIRQKQIKLVSQHFEEHPDHKRVIIFGDFNSIPTNASVQDCR